jgi:hypothetical protein
VSEQEAAFTEKERACCFVWEIMVCCFVRKARSFKNLGFAVHFVCVDFVHFSFFAFSSDRATNRPVASLLLVVK